MIVIEISHNLFHHQKVSQGVTEKKQHQESSLEQSLPPRKYITRRPQISKIIKVGDR